MILDFDKQLLKEILSLKLPYKVKIGSLTTNDSIAISSLPGGVTVRSFFDGVEDKQLPFEISIKVNSDQQQASEALNLIAQHLEQLDTMQSDNGSFDFSDIKIASAPFVAYVDEKGNWIYVTNITADLTVYNRKEDK